MPSVSRHVVRFHYLPRPRRTSHRPFYRASSYLPCRSFAAYSAPTGHVSLPFRRLIELRGHDAPQFLQGLTTANIPTKIPDRPTAIYSAFLNAQGRLLQDVFIYPLRSDSPILANGHARDSVDPVYLIEVDSGQISALVKWLRKYKLRSKVFLRPVPPDELAVFSMWDDNVSSNQLASIVDEKLKQLCTVSVIDNRAPGFGLRLLYRTERHSAPNPQGDALQYAIRRFLFCVPEGQAELHPESALVHESNMDYMGGVDFRKGCYVGQELVIRTQHTGVVRKRILPCVLYREGQSPPEELAYNATGSQSEQRPLAGYIPAGADIKGVVEEGSRARSKGKWIAGGGNIGLALCRLEDMVGLGPTGESAENWDGRTQWCFDWQSQDADAKQLRIKGFVPGWWTQRRKDLQGS